MEPAKQFATRISAQCALDVAYNALQVLILTPETRAWLEQNDPQALRQAIAAVDNCKQTGA